MVDRTPGGHQPPRWVGFALQPNPVLCTGKTAAVPPRFHGTIIPNDANLTMITPRIHGPVIAEEMEVLKHETQHFRLGQQILHCRPKCREIFLVEHLVGLQIQPPLASAMRQREVSLLREDSSSLPAHIIPYRLDDPDFLRTDRPDQVQRVVVRSTDVDHKFIDHR